MSVKNFLRILIEDRVYAAFLLIKRRRSITIPEWVKRKSERKMAKKSCFFQDNNSIYPVNIVTPDGMNQCVHPDIIKVGDSIDDKRYIMVVSPYPFSYEVFENPVLYQSDDLVSWKYIQGPIDFPKVGGVRQHFSDPAIVKTDSYICFYRECLYDSEQPRTNIFIQRSEDLIHWHSKELVFSDIMKECDIISPSVYIDERGMLTFWSCVKMGKEIKLMRSIGDKITKEKFSYFELRDMPEGKILWHVSVIKYDLGEIFLMVLADDFGGSNGELYIGRFISEEEVKIIRKVGIKEQVPQIEVEYRASGLIEDDILKIIASVRYNDKTWGCVLLEVDNAESLFRN